MQEVVDAAALQTGFEITEHFLQLSGVCAACRAGASGAPGPSGEIAGENAPEYSGGLHVDGRRPTCDRARRGAPPRAWPRSSPARCCSPL